MIEPCDYSETKKRKYKKGYAYATNTLIEFDNSPHRCVKVSFEGISSRTVYLALKKANERKQFDVDIVTRNGEVFLAKKGV